MFDTTVRYVVSTLTTAVRAFEAGTGTAAVRVYRPDAVAH